MIYALSKLREFVRGLDERLQNTAVYPDSWIDDKIEEGIAVAQDIKPVFIMKEKYDLTINFTPTADGGDGLDTVEIILQEEPHSIQTTVFDTSFFECNVTYNNHLVLSKKENAPNVTDKTVTVVYFYHPTLPFVDIEMSMDMYRFVRSGIAANCYSWLSDEVNEKYHLDKARMLSVSSTLDIDQDALSIDETKLWRKSWA